MKKPNRFQGMIKGMYKLQRLLEEDESICVDQLESDRKYLTKEAIMGELYADELYKGYFENDQYEHGMTLDEIGEELGVTRERIREIEKRALRRLKLPKNSRQLKSFL